MRAPLPANERVFFKKNTKKREVNELKRGNYIYYRDVPSTIFSIHKNGELGISYANLPISYQIATDNCNVADCEPIPLDEEWLLKFGFEKDKIIFQKEIHIIELIQMIFTQGLESIICKYPPHRAPDFYTHDLFT